MALIQNIISTVFNSQNAASTIRDLTNVNKNITRLGQSSASAGRAFSSQAAGLGGLVAAYAGAAATTFALQQAFSALASAARAGQTLDGLKSLATASGESSTILLRNVREITKNQLTLTEAAQQINLSLSAGFNTDQIERLGSVALKASRALGRDLTDAYTRVVRGSAKLETELLDELGIYTRIDPAVRAYADANNRVISSLTDFERRQAFVNAVISEGERKFKSINTTVPTTSEKIEAFGTRIIDIATKLGMFLADIVAPLAEFLTTNLAGSFGTVGLAAGLMAATLQRVSREALQRFQDSAALMAVKVNQSILSATSGFSQLQTTAQTAIAGVTGANKGLINGSAQELKALKEVAQQRRLNTVELEKSQGILNQRVARLNELRRSEIQQILNTRAQRAAAAAAGQSTSAYNDQLRTINKRLQTTNALLSTTATQLTAVNAAAAAGPARFAAFASGIVTLGALGAASVARLAVGFVGLGGFILSAVSIVSLLAAGISKLTGKQEEFNQVTKKLGAAVSAFFNADDLKTYNNTFLSTTAAAMAEAEKANSTLKELDTFRIKSKIVGIDIVIEKTKEDLVKEVASILTAVASESEKTIGQSIGDAATSWFSIIGGILGTVIPGVGNLVGFAIGAALGTIIGSVVDQLSEDLPKVTDDTTKKLISNIAQTRLDLSSEESIALFDDENLSRALQLLTDQVGATRDLSFAGRLAYETQVQLLIAQARNLNNARILNQLVANTGLSAAEIDRKFGFDKINDFITNVTTKELSVPVTFRILNEEAVLNQIKTISDEIDSLITVSSNTPEIASNLGLIDIETRNQLRGIISDIAAYEAALTSAERKMSEMGALPGITGQENGYIDLTTEVAIYNTKLDELKSTYEELQASATNLLGNLTNISENFRNLGESTVLASNSALLATNSLTDLQTSIQSGTITLESYSQAISTIDKNIDRFRSQATNAATSLSALEPIVASFRAALETLPEDSALRPLIQNTIAVYETLYDTIIANEAEITALVTSRDAVLANAGGIKAQLELSKQLKDSFGSILTQNVDLLNIFTTQGSIISTNEERERSRFEFLNRVARTNNTALEAQRKLTAAINADTSVSAVLGQAILSTTAETYDVFLDTLSAQDRQIALNFKALALTSEQLIAAQNARDALTIQQNLFLDNLSALIQITSEINKQNDALQQRIGILQAQNAVAAAQRNLSSVQLNNSIAQNSTQLDIRNAQAELVKLQIAENKASGGGVDAKKAALELVKSEIALRQVLSNIQLEATNRQLQANLEAAQKTKQAFESVATTLDLTGALTGIGAILTNQLELLELEKQQADERYKNTLETLAIERQILEAELTAASGAQKISEANIAAQLGILKAEQQLELDSLSNTLAELEARDKLLDRQNELQIVQARAEEAKARADVAALRAQGEQNISFLDARQQLDNAFLAELAKLITQLAQQTDPAAAEITATKISENFNDASKNFNTAISELENFTNTVYGGLVNGQAVRGMLFDELANEFTASKAAIETEIKALKKRADTLVEVQALELSNAEAQLRAEQGGGASRLAELEAQLNAITAQEAQAGAEREKIVAEASKKQAEAIRQFATDVIATIGKFITAQKQAKINTLLEEEAQLKDILAFQTEALSAAQSAASNALQEEISLREQLKDATESLIESQTSYLDSIAGNDGASVTEASKNFIDTLLDQKQAIFDLQRATRGRIAADSRLSSLEGVQAQLTDAITLKTAQRISAEESLEKTQEKLALVTKLVSGEIGNFIKSLGSLGSSLSGLSGGGSFGQVFSNLLGFQDAIAGFTNIGNIFAKASGTQLAAANTQQQAAANLNNAVSSLAPASSLRPVARADGLAAGASVASGSAGAASGLTFSGLASTAFAGAGIGSLVGALTGDTSWASTVGGAVGSTLATVFAGSTFVGAVSGGIATLATSAGFAAAGAASIALIATPLVFAAIGALIIGALFGKKKPKPQAVISGTVTGEGFDTSSISSRDLSRSNISALESIPQQVFAGFLSNFEAAGLQFKDSADVTINFYKGKFKKIETTFSSGLSTTAKNIGKSAQDAADELERQFFRGLGAESFEVDQFTPSREDIQQALKTFGEINDLDQKTRERFIEGLEYAQEFDNIVRSFLATSVDINDIFNTIDSAANSLAENKLNEYLSELDKASRFLGASSAQYTRLSAAIRSNALSLIGLAEASDGSLVSTRELASNLNAGAIAIRNIIAETTALRSTFVGLGNVLSGINIDTAISQAVNTRLAEFVGDFSDSINLAIDILRDPARIILVDLEKFIVNGTQRIRQAVGVYDGLLQGQAAGIVMDADILNTSFNTISSATELLNLELKGFISTISDKRQLQAIIDGAEAIDDYAGAIAKSAAESRLAEVNEIERTQATQQFNKVSREFTKRLREITGAASGLTIGGEGVSFIDILDAFGTTEIDQAARDFKQYLDLINSGSSISNNFNSAIDFLNTRFDNGETDSLKFVSALELLQRVTLETIDSIGQLTDAYESTLQQINEAFNSSRTALVDSVRTLGDELVSLIKSVSDQTQEILSIYDNAVSSVAETGSAIFDLRDAAKDAFTSAADAVAEFEKANKLSGRSSAQVRAELESVSAQIADSLGAQSFDLGSFIELSGLTSQQSSLQRELKRLGTVESEYETLLKTRTEASEGLAFVEENISKLSGTLTDARSTESKIIQDTRKAVEDYTAAQATLGEVTATLAENNFDLTQTRIDETSAVLKLNEALRGLNRDSLRLDTIIGDILQSSDSTLRDAFIDGAISNLAGELATLDETARAARIAEVTLVAANAFDALVPLAASIKNLGDSETVNTMAAVSEATNLTTDTFASLLGVFNADNLDPVQTLINEVNRFSAISAEIENVSAFSAGLLNLGVQTSTTGADVALLVSDLNALERQLTTLTSDTGVESLREVFKGLAIDLQKSWDENVVLGLPDVINLSAISVAPDGGLNELKTIASNSANAKVIDRPGLNYKTVALAEGGYVDGPGTSTSDSIPAQLSNGEYVLKASTVNKLGVNLLNSLNSSGDLSSIIASEGRFGDSKVAHINDNEARLLKRFGGSGTRNPVTGMLEFFGGASSGAQGYGGLFADEEAALLYKNYSTFFNTNSALEAQSNGRARVNSTDAYMQANISKLLNSTKTKSGVEVTSFAPAVGKPGSQNRYSLASARRFGNMLADNYSATAQMLAVRDINQNTIGTSNNFIGASKSKTPTSLIGRNNARLSKGLPTGSSNFQGISTSSLSWLSGLAEKTTESTNLGSFRKVVDEQNKANSLFFDFYMLKDAYSKIPKTVKASQGELQAATKKSRDSRSKKDETVRKSFGIDTNNDGKNDAYVSWNEDQFGKQVGDMTIREATKFDRAVESGVSSVKRAIGSTTRNSAGGGLVGQSGALHSLSKTKGPRDSISAMLQPGEFVLRKPAVDRMGVDTAIRLNSTGNTESDVNVEVNVINNSSPVTPTIQQTRRENGKIIVDVILEDIRNNGPIRQSIRGAK